MLKLLKRGSRATAAVAAAQGTMQLSSFVRYAVIARLLSPAEFGIAALVAGAAQLGEIISSAGADTILIQAPDGDDERLQRSIHLQRAIRGALNGLLLYLVAGPLAAILGLSQCVDEIRLLAAFPFIRGFYHTDCSRLQRHMRFNPWIITEVGTNVITSGVSIVLAVFLKDHRAVVAGVLLQALIAVTLSHAISERRYRWSYDRTVLRRYYKFSWPLVANSILLFAITQGDRLVIGSARTLLGNSSLTLQQIGLYSSVATITMAPSFAIANVILSLGLPYLSQVQTDEDGFGLRFQRLLQWGLVIALCYFAPLVLYGPSLITAVVGEQYVPSFLLVTAMAAAWAFRIIRAVPTVAALAQADTHNGLQSNLVRAAGLGCISAAVGQNGTLGTVAVIGAIAEISATIISFFQLSKLRHRVVRKALPVLLVGAVVASLLVLIQSAPVSPLLRAAAFLLLAVTVFRTCRSVRLDLNVAIK